MRKAIIILILCISIWTSAGFIKPAFCHAAQVRDVVARDVEGAIHLNITVWHDVETSLHYVDTIEVTWGANITSLTVDPKPLAPDGTFTIDYNMGPVSGTPTISVRARCTITGYSGAISWTGTIPEPSPTPTPTSTPTLTPTSSPTPSISPSPSPSPTVTPSPSPTATASPSPSLSPTLQPTVTPESKPGLLLPIETLYLIIAVIVAVVAIVVVLAMALRRRKND